jgi:hypothetical protein
MCICVERENERESEERERELRHLPKTFFKAIFKHIRKSILCKLGSLHMVLEIVAHRTSFQIEKKCVV